MTPRRAMIFKEMAMQFILASQLLAGYNDC